MKVSFATAVLFAAGLLASASARADAQPMTIASATPAPVAAATSSSAPLEQTTAPVASPAPITPINANAPHSLFGWAGVGLYSVSVSVTVDGFTASGSTTNFGFNAGAAKDFLALTPALPLAGFANVAIAFGSDFTVIPITAGAAVHYDQLPVSLFGGLGFTIMPNTGNSGTPLGLGIVLMGSYPLPQVRPGMSVLAQFQYHFMDDGFSLLVFDVGAGLSF